MTEKRTDIGERRYTSREVLDKVMPTEGMWLCRKECSDLWWFPVAGENTGRPMLLDGEPYDGIVNDSQWVDERDHAKSGLCVIPRSEAIDLMAKAIEAGDQSGERTEMVESKASEQPAWYTTKLAYSQQLGGQAYEFKCRTCGYVEHRLSGRGFEPPTRCHECVKSKASPLPDPYAHLPHGGWWYDNGIYLFHWPNKSAGGQRFTRDGQPDILNGENSCFRYTGEEPTIDREAVIAIIQEHQVKDEGERVSDAPKPIDPHEFELVKALVTSTGFSWAPKAIVQHARHLLAEMRGGG